MIINAERIYVGGVRAFEAIQASTTLTHAQIAQLRAIPITLVAAPGSGKILYPLAVALSFDVTTTGYTVGTNDLVVRLKDGTGTIMTDTIDAAGFLDQTVDMFTTGNGLKDVKAVVSTMSNQPLVLHNSGGSEFSGGNSANLLKATVFYHVVTL